MGTGDFRIVNYKKWRVWNCVMLSKLCKYKREPKERFRLHMWSLCWTNMGWIWSLLWFWRFPCCTNLSKLWRLSTVSWWEIQLSNLEVRNSYATWFLYHVGVWGHLPIKSHSQFPRLSVKVTEAFILLSCVDLFAACGWSKNIEADVIDCICWFWVLAWLSVVTLWQRLCPPHSVGF